MTFLPNKAKVFLVKVFEKKATAIFATTVLHFVKWLSYDKKRFILLYYDSITIYINSKSKYTKKWGTKGLVELDGVDDIWGPILLQC